MKNVNMVNVQIYSDRTYSLPEKMTEFLNFMIEKFNQIPESFRNDASVEFEADDGYCDIKIGYRRPETTEEATMIEAVAKAVRAADAPAAALREQSGDLDAERLAAIGKRAYAEAHPSERSIDLAARAMAKAIQLPAAPAIPDALREKARGIIAMGLPSSPNALAVWSAFPTSGTQYERCAKFVRTLANGGTP